jgi:hypothetical protein
MGRDRIEYQVLRSLGASPAEILETLLQATMGDLASTTFILAMNLPGNLRLNTLLDLLDRFGLHPLSLALHLEDQLRAQTLLRRLGLAEVYGRWIGPQGGLLIQREAYLKALPPGLIVTGDARIEDCPELVDLGKGLVVTMGTLAIRRCPKLQRLPGGLRGNVVLVDCGEIEPPRAGAAEEGGAC